MLHAGRSEPSPRKPPHFIPNLCSALNPQRRAARPPMPPPFIPNLCSALNPQRLDLVRLQVDLVLGERNEEAHLFAPFSPANLAHKPKGGPPPEAGSARRLRLSFDGPVPAPPARAPQLSFGEEDAMMENNHHHHAAADSVDAEPSRAALYDPKTNYTSPRRRFLHNKPNPRIEMYRHGGSAARRLDEGLASESSEESVTTTTDDDLTEEEQEQVQQQIPEESSALAAAPSEAEDAAAVPAAVPCVLPPEPALGSPCVPLLTSEPAAASPPVRVLASEPASPRTPVSKQIAAHTATINDISFEDREYIGSCSDDGTVVISNLFSDEKLKFEYHRPMKAIALDPEYSRNYKRFATGGLAGQVLVLTKKSSGGGYNKKVLREGEGPIHSMKWRADLLAWANDAGVKVHDMRTDRGIAFIERPKGIARPEVLLPHLVWQDDTVLVIGWGTSVKIAAIRTESQALNGFQRSTSAAVSDKYVDIVGSFQTGYHISGIAPFGDLLVMLAYIPEADDKDKKISTSAPLRQGTAQRPEIHLVSWKNDVVTTDALPIHGYEHYKAKDYTLAHAPFSGSSNAGGQWAAGDEPLYYIVSPKDIVVAKPRDTEDHIAWLLQHGWHEKALAAVEEGQGRTELLNEVGSRYLDHLIIERKYAEAAQLCPKILRGSPSAWERWVFHFAHLRQLSVLIPYIPIDNPQLSDTAYEVALVALTTNATFHELLLTTIKSWPHALYSASPVISAIEPQLRSSSMTNPLKEALAELYVINSQYEKALSLYAELLKPEVFEFIEKHNLHDAIHDKVVNLMILDSKRAIHLLIQHRDIIPPSEVVEQLLHTSQSCDKKYLLHQYLHALFETDIHAGKDYHDMQLELYADYEPRMLIPFLRTSQHYRLDKAYEIFKRRELVREQVFVLGRMGNAKEALSTIINKLEDIQEAVEFVTEQRDDDLWEELIKQCLQKPEMVGMLLEHTVGNLDPLYIVNLVPDGLEIPKLRDRLVKIVTDYRTETSLRNGCNDILKTDCVNLLVKYYQEARRGVCMSTMDEEAQGTARADEGSSRIGERSSTTLRSLEVKSRTRCGARCCLCFDPLSIQDIFIVFYCCHAYHQSCLEGGLDSMKSNTRDSDEDSEDDDGSPSAESKMRCVLCTTAAT